MVDPFAGGGSIPLEALRIGADTFASDLNPVAIMLNKVVLEYAPKYGTKLVEEVRRWGDWIKNQAKQELSEFYPKDVSGTTPIAYLWARTITCEGPGCGCAIPLLRSTWLSKARGKQVAIRLFPSQDKKQIDFEIIENAKVRDVGEGTVRRGSAKCPVCGYTTPVDSVRRQLKNRHGGTADARLFAVISTKAGAKGKFYRLSTPEDLIVAHMAEAKLQLLQKENQNIVSLVPDEPLPPQGTLGFRVQLYGMGQFSDLFISRQLLTLTTLARLVKEAGIQIKKEYDEDFATAVQSVLACALNREAEHSSSLCRWNPTGEKLQATFGHQTLRMLWDFCETNVFGNSVGSWDNIMECVIAPFDVVSGFNNTGTSILASATQHPLSNNMAQVFATDPPYYDAVPYADLSDFFYVWFKRTLRSKLPDLFNGDLTPKDEECVVDEIKGHDKAYFESMMSKAMSEGCRILAPEGIGVVVFAHQTTSGWETQLQSMIDAGWTITGSWPIDTEMSTRLRAMDSAALVSSVHLVCRPRKNTDGSLKTNYVGDWRDILQDLPKSIHEWMPRLAAEGVVGADAIFSCLGPALEIFSQYSSVERADGAPVTLKEYLEYVWAAVSREALATIFQGADTSGFEPDSRLTATWLWTMFAEGDKNGNGDRNKETQQNGTATQAEGEERENEEDEDEDQEESSPKPGVNGFAMEYDTARKLAQGLGVHLDKVGTLVEVKGGVARLRSLRERARFLFEKGGDELSAARPKKKKKDPQLSWLELPEMAEEIGDAEEQVELPEFTVGSTVLDRVHQAMLIYSSGRSDALKHFIIEEGVGSDPRFWKLALALSSLYPRQSDERRWIDGIQNQKKLLGF